jgi:hypothetical protein
MPATVIFKGNLGNQLFQYATAIVFCVKHKIKLETPPTKKLLNILTFNETLFSIDEFNDNKKIKRQSFTFRSFDKNNELVFKGYNCHYIFCDFFQNTDYLNNNYEIIKNNIYPINYDCRSYLCNYEKIKNTDVVFILRLGDFKHQGMNTEVVHPDYFLNILKTHDFSNIYILCHPCDDKDINKYMKHFTDCKQQITLLENRSELIDFNIVKYFKNIALTNSTFNWWSCFLLENIHDKTIFLPKLIGYLGIDKKFKCHGNFIKNLHNIRNHSIPIENKYINLR